MLTAQFYFIIGVNCLPLCGFMCLQYLKSPSDANMSRNKSALFSVQQVLTLYCGYSVFTHVFN